ncbi:MAG: ribonuclease HII [Muribaculaceae bacterium]|nr:ribonuclease HII [Muribaculaceae bacterium]
MLLPYMHKDLIEAGCDEAGRGCLCGPVSCAAVILPPDFECEELNDSKKLSAERRAELRPIIEREALAWAVVMVDAEEIDSINILNASILGMHRALDRLEVRPQHILVDGNRFRPYFEPSGLLRPADEMPVAHTTVVKGDGKYMSIAAASILAKTHRDELMTRLAQEYPGYGWERNMGYPTPAHKEAIRRLGPTPCHRRSFRWK